MKINLTHRIFDAFFLLPATVQFIVLFCCNISSTIIHQNRSDYNIFNKKAIAVIIIKIIITIIIKILITIIVIITIIIIIIIIIRIMMMMMIIIMIIIIIITIIMNSSNTLLTVNSQVF